MARTYVEDRFLVKGCDRRLAAMMGWHDEDLALGKVVRLWKLSQADSAVYGTALDISIWANIRDDAQLERFIQALCHPGVGVLENVDNDKYKIRGNRDHVDKLQSLKEAAKAGGAATKKKLKNKNPNNLLKIDDQTAGHKAPPNGAQLDGQMAQPNGAANGIHEDGQTADQLEGQNQENGGPYSVQFNAAQCSSVQFDAVDDSDGDEKEPGHPTFEVRPEFRASKLLPRVLQYISPTTQDNWVIKYQPTSWLIETLETAVLHYEAKANGGEVDEWGMKLTSWVKRERAKKSKFEVELEENSDPFGFDGDRLVFERRRKA